MARAYSNDLRQKLWEAHDRGEGSLRELAGRFGVSGPWAWKISAQQLRTGQTERVEQRYGPRSKVTGAVEGQLRSWILKQPDLTLAELPIGKLRAVSEVEPQQRLWERQRLPISIGRLWGVLRELRLPSKKVAPRPTEQDTPEARERRPAWREQVSQIDPGRLVFLDESGVTKEMTRR
ncbi:MAG: hypothetical protein HYX73_10235 [Acidobacteria bacterium]|nr:hypothetical protein [Acidobacteriota bacterium]